MNMRRMLIVGIMGGIIFTGVIPCSGQVPVTWTGSSPSGNYTVWEEPNNWDVGWVPGSDNPVTIPGGLTYYPNLTTGEQFCLDIHIQPGAQLNVESTGNAVLHVGGNWLNEGTFIPGGGTVRLVESIACTLSAETFNRLEHNKYYVTPFGIVSGYAYLTGDITILDEITFEYGTLVCGGYTLIGSGASNSLLLQNGTLKWGCETFTSSFETVDFDTGSVVFNGMIDQTVPSMYDYFNLELSGAGTKTLDGDVAVNGRLRIQNATFDARGHQVDVGRDFNIGNGMFMMGDESVLTMRGGGVSLSPRSVFSAIGTGGRTGPIISKHPTSSLYYSFNVYGDSAVISASYATFEWMDIMGVDIDSGAIVDPSHPMDNCTFQHGNPASFSSALIHIDNNQEVTIPYANFPVMGTTNVRKETDYGRTTFLNATGIFAGESYEIDFFNRIDWTHTVQPDEPLAVIERAGNSVNLIWNTVSRDTVGNPIIVDAYNVYSDSDPNGSFLNLESTVLAPDTTWSDVGIIDTSEMKFYIVTAVQY